VRGESARHRGKLLSRQRGVICTRKGSKGITPASCLGHDRARTPSIPFACSPITGFSPASSPRCCATCVTACRCCASKRTRSSFTKGCGRFALSGWDRLSQDFQKGTGRGQATLGVIEPGNFFWEMALLDRQSTDPKLKELAGMPQMPGFCDREQPDLCGSAINKSYSAGSQAWSCHQAARASLLPRKMLRSARAILATRIG